MHYHRLGASGLQVSRFSLGSWATYGGPVDEARARDCILTAYEMGVNFFDNAEVYARGRAEEIVGAVLAELPRSSFVVSSKVFWGGDRPNERGLSHKHVVEACHAALRRLRVDHLDLYYCHRPDPDTPILETARAMDILVRQGKVLYWGTSEWRAEQIEEAYAVAERYNLVPPTVEQPQYNLFHRDRVEQELAPLCRERGLGLTTWSPLASGILTGKYLDGIPEGSRLAHPDYAWLQQELTPERLAVVRELSGIAEEAGVSLAQLALAWTARNPVVSSVITGASRPEQVRENLRADELVESLDEAVFVRVEQVLVQAGL